MGRIALGLLIIISFLLLSCRKDEPPCLTCPPPNRQQLRLDTLFVDPTQIWLRVYTIDSTNVGLIELYRDSVPILAGMVSRNEITTVDSGLLPNFAYNYRAYRWENGIRVDSTALLVVRTMDTTSHNFTWEMDTLGDGASSVLNDLAIINDTLVYAVGKIYLKDSTGNFDPLPYNLAEWNGKRWALQRATVYYQGNPAVPPLEAIFLFSETDMWVTSGFPIHGDGTRWTLYRLPDLGINASVSRMWGTSSMNMYFVGTNGSVVRYNGGTWQNIQSGTSLPIQDIWGAIDKTGNPHILAVASNKFFNEGKAVLEIQGSIVTSYPDTGLTWSLSGIWFQHKEIKYVAGGGLFKRTESQHNSPWVDFHQGLTTYYTDAIRGQNSNDIVVVGAYGVVLHYNGVTWKNFQSQTYLDYGAYYAVAIRGNLVVAVGENNARAVALIGRR